MLSMVIRSVDFDTRLEAQVPNDRGRHIHKDRLPANLKGAKVTRDHPANTAKALTFHAADKRTLNMPYPEILKITQAAARLQQTAISPVNLAHMLYGKIVER